MVLSPEGVGGGGGGCLLIIPVGLQWYNYDHRDICYSENAAATLSIETIITLVS